jgi:hypothetical protein
VTTSNEERHWFRDVRDPELCPLAEPCPRSFDEARVEVDGDD